MPVASAPSTAPRNAEPASQAPASVSSKPAVDITALTTRDDFLLELGQTLAGQAAIRPVDTLDAALEALDNGKRAQILVIDARAVANARAAVDTTAASIPHALMLVFTDASAEKQTAALLKGSPVFAVLPTPVDARKTQMVFEGAIAEAVAARSRAPLPAAASELSLEEFRGQTAAPAEPPRSGADPKSKLLLIGAAVAALAAAGGGFWYFTRGQTAPAAPSAAAPAAAAPAAAGSAAAPGTAPAAVGAPEPVADTSIVQGKVDELLEKARLAMHERRFTEPAGDNALVYYRSAVAADAQNAEARDGLQRVAGVLAARFDEAMNASHFDEAAQTLANFKAAAPADPRVPGFEQRLYSGAIGKAIADGNLDRAAGLMRQAQAAGSVSAEQLAKYRADISRHMDDAKVTRLATLVEDRIRDGRLLEADDGAKVYLAQLLAIAGAGAAAEHVQRELGTAYLRKAREAALAKNSADEERWLNEARAAGMKQSDIAAYQRDLNGARQKSQQADSERALQAARERIRDGRLTDPAQDSAAYYLTQLQSGDPANAGLVEASHELAAKLLERARVAAGAGQSPDADLLQAKRWGADPKDVAAVQQLSAPRAQAAPDPATLAVNLKRLRTPAPEYPQTALDKKLSGVVTLQFTVDVHGDTRDVHVVEASPAGVFDQAAVNAIRHWRYAPMVVNGTAVEVPVKTLMRFELPK
jgi:TonB family protein